MNFRWGHDMVPNCGIYCIENRVTGYCYWGQSVRLSARLKGHRSALIAGTHDNKFMQRSFNKHGLDNFTFKVVLYCERWELTRCEVAIEHAHKPFNYNMRPCADSNKGIKFSAETKQHIRLLRSGKKISDETRRKLSESRMGNTNTKGYKHTEETKRKMSAKLVGNTYTKGYKHTEEAKRNMSESRKGRKTSDATRHKISDLHKGKKMPDSVRQALYNAHIGKKLSEETRHKMSESRMGVSHVVSDESRRKMSIAKTGKKASDAAKQNMSKAQLGRKHSASTKLKMSTALMGNTRFKGKIPWNKGISISEETRLKISAANKKRWTDRKEHDNT